jgi:hypothetical protein
MVMDQSVVDKRKHVRLAMRWTYRLTITGAAYSGLTGNISLGGAYLETLDRPMPSDALAQSGRIVIVRNGIEVVNSNCRVVYIGGITVPYPVGIGVTFEEMDETAVARLRETLVEAI